MLQPKQPSKFTFINNYLDATVLVSCPDLFRIDLYPRWNLLNSRRKPRPNRFVGRVQFSNKIKQRFVFLPENFFSRLQHPNKAANVLEADHQQKVTMKFQLRDRSSGKVMTAHQTFIRLTNLETQQEIIFVSEPDASDTYKFDLVSCNFWRIVSISSTILFVKVCLHGTYKPVSVSLALCQW